MYDPDAQKLRCAATAAKWRTAYRNRRAASDSAALARTDLERRSNFAAVSSGTDYEYFVRDILTAAGYSVRRVGGSCDLGADLLVTTPAGLVVIQCKFYSQPVGYSSVQEAYTARALYSAAFSIVCSNARFTRQARRTATKLGVKLTHHGALVSFLNKISSHNPSLTSDVMVRREINAQ